MRHMLILALAVALVAARRSFSDEPGSIRETIYRPGVEYQYHYESQVLTGIHTVSNQQSGVKIQCTVKMQVHRDGSTVLKMQHITVSKVNDEVDRSDDSKILSDDQVTKLNGEQAEQMIQQLSKPIKCRFDGGEVRDIKTVPSDKYWSVNIKKGLLSLLQLKLTGRSSQSSDSDSYSDSYRPRNRFQDIVSPHGSRRQSGRTDKTFKVMESDVNGECETKYFVNSERSSDSSSVSDMKVTKTKDFSNCLQKNSFEQGLFAGMPHYSSEKKLIQPSMVAEYELTGDRQHYLIKKASLKAKYIFTPYGPESRSFSTVINQKLRLTSTEQIQSPLTSESFVPERQGLKMDIPHSNYQPENRDRSERSTDSQNEWQYKETIDAKLTQLLSAIYPTIHETSAAQLMQLNLIVRHVPRRQLVDIVKSYKRQNSEESKKKCDILLDIMPTIQTPDVAKALIDLIRDGSVSGVRAGLSLSAMSLTVGPLPDVVKSLLNLYKDGTSLERETPHIRQSILLSVGTICNKMINMMRRKNKPVPEFISTVEEVSIELTTLLEQSVSERDTIRVLKAMGNLGSKELIRPLKTIIDNLNQPKIVRQQAIFALRKLTKHSERDQVHPILISIIMSKTESTTLRISAFQVLKKCQPSYSTLQLIGQSLSSEQSSQVKTFIYSSLVQMANTDSHIPELQETQKNARKVLKVIRAIPIGPTDSLARTARVYSDRLELGTAFSMWTVKSESTGLPKSIVGSLYKTVFGNRLHVLEGGIEGTGLDSVLRRFTGPNGIIKQLMKSTGASWSWRDLLNSQSSSSSRYGDRLRNFLGRKPFEPRLDDDIKGLLYGEILGNEVVYRRFDKESIERTVSSVLMRSPELMRKLKEGMNIDKLQTLSIVQNSLVLPTPMGIPLSLNVSASGILKVVGHLKINSMPSISDFLIRRPYLNKKFEIEGTIKPSCNVEVLGYMGVDMRWLRTGTGLKGNFIGKLPLKGQITVDPVDSKVTIKYDPPQEKTKLFKIKSVPTTFVFLIPKTVEQLPMHPEWRPIKHSDPSTIATFEREHNCHTSGFNWQVKAQWTKCKMHCCSCYPMTGKQELEVTFEPIEKGTPKEIVLKVQKFTQELYNEDSSSSSSSDYEYDSLSSSSNQPQNYRTSSRDTDSSEFEQDFEQVDKDEMISTPRKVQVFMELGYNGYRSSKKIQSKLTWITENNFMKHHVNVQFVGKASGDMTPFKVMANGAFRCPINVESLSHTVNPGDTVGKLEVSWGVSGFKERSLKCKIWESDSQSWNQELQTDGIEQPNGELFTSGGPGKKFCYGIEVEFPHMSRSGHVYLAKAIDTVKLVLDKTGKDVQVGVPEHMPTNKILVFTQFNVKQSKVSVLVKTPRETDFIPDLNVNSPWSQYKCPRYTDQSPSEYQYFNSSSTDFDLDWLDNPQYDEYERHSDFYPTSLSGECKVHRGKMQTFDGTPLLLPIYDSETSSSRCDVLLAQDCSDRGTFSVTGSFKRGRWTIKALVADNVIELTPDNNEDKVTCKVNGEEMRVRSSMPVYVRESQQDQSSPVSCKIEKTDEGLKLKLRDLGVSIELTDNSKIFIKVKPWSMLQGRLCGLCGNHNYDQSDDMTSLDRKLMYSSRHFVLDSVLPSSYCDASDYERQLGSRHESFCRKQKTLKIERSVNGQEQTCFSTQPVTVCRKHCSPQSETERNVRFSCAPRDSDTVDRLRQLLKSGVSDLSSELSSLPTTELSEQIELPTSCSSNN